MTVYDFRVIGCIRDGCNNGEILWEILYPVSYLRIESNRFLGSRYLSICYLSGGLIMFQEVYLWTADRVFVITRNNNLHTDRGEKLLNGPFNLFQNRSQMYVK